MWPAEIFTLADGSVAASLMAAPLLFSSLHGVLSEKVKREVQLVPVSFPMQSLAES